MLKYILDFEVVFLCGNASADVNLHTLLFNLATITVTICLLQNNLNNNKTPCLLIFNTGVLVMTQNWLAVLPLCAGGLIGCHDELTLLSLRA